MQFLPFDTFLSLLHPDPSSSLEQSESDTALFGMQSPISLCYPGGIYSLFAHSIVHDNFSHRLLIMLFRAPDTPQERILRCVETNMNEVHGCDTMTGASETKSEVRELKQDRTRRHRTN
jgi:hypothetical protein